MRVFFDTEFTGLTKRTSLLSIGCVSEDGRTFYAENLNYDKSQIDDWIRENVLVNMRFTGQYSSIPRMDFEHYDMLGETERINQQLCSWIEQFDIVEMWSDCLAYDWVLFCDLFGGALHIPQNVYYIPFDLATLMKIKGIDPDINREEFSGIVGEKHNALHDARAIKACYEKLMKGDPK